MVEGSQSTCQVIVVESATHITMATAYKANLIRPGEGPWAGSLSVATWPLM